MPATILPVWISGGAAPLFNEDEIDLNLQWIPDKAGPLRGLSFRLRYAEAKQRGLAPRLCHPGSRADGIRDRGGERRAGAGNARLLR